MAPKPQEATAPEAWLPGLPGEAPAGAWLLLAVFFLGLAWTVYAPALSGPLISDDVTYLLNPWVAELTAENVREILDSTSQATRSLNNYAPLRALVNAVEYWSFGPNSYPYHLINVVLHALAALLLVALFRRAAVPWWAAALGGTLFLAHPANVEAVAWMTQVWSPLAMALGVGALLARQSLLGGSALFALALLTRPTAASLIAPAVLVDWCRARREPDSAEGARLAWLPLWSVMLALYALAEFTTFFVTESGAPDPIHPDPWVQARSSVALVARYGVLAATGLGASAWHQPAPALSLLDPWWLAGLALLGLLAARALRALRRGSDEAPFLVWAAVGFAPVSQIFPFLYPMADRYLYFILPGLLGAALVVLRDALGRLELRPRQRAAAIVLAVGAALTLHFAIASHARARLWRSEELLLMDSARQYPEGVPGLLLQARATAVQGDVEGTLALLTRCRERGWDFYGAILAQPFYAPVRDDPRFVAFLHEMAAERIARTAGRRWPTQPELRDVASAHELRGERREAIEMLERALQIGGPLDAELRARLGPLRAAEGRRGR